MKWYEQNGIDENRYNELKHYARQYTSFRKLRTDAETMRKNAHKAQQIEAAAHAASPELYPWIMENVTTGRSFAQLKPPCGSAQFFRARYRFFIELNALKT